MLAKSGHRKLLKRMVPPCIVRYRCQAIGRKIALTFDDGPLEGRTEHVLERLQERRLDATFFVIGKLVEQAPDLCQAIVQQGCEIANHSYTHPLLFSALSRQRLEEEIVRTDEIVESVVGARPREFRPPYGALSPQLLWYLRWQRRESPVLWSACIRDEVQRGRDDIVRELREMELAPGDILLLHDTCEETVVALPRLLDILAERNLECVALSELL